MEEHALLRLCPHLGPLELVFVGCLLDDGPEDHHLLRRVVLHSAVFGNHDNLRSLERDDLGQGERVRKPRVV